MKTYGFNLFLITSFSYLLPLSAAEYAKVETKMDTSEAPKFLYKLLSIQDWADSRQKNFVQLSQVDHLFVHLATENQLEKVTEKFWATIPQYVILKLETSQLAGRLVYEANPGSTNKYYHLYDGAIPLKSIVEVQLVTTNKKEFS